MATKRLPSPNLISNPFIKKRNLQWSLDLPSHETTTIHPPSPSPPLPQTTPPPSSAAIESGTALVTSHSHHFLTHLTPLILTPYPPLTPQLPLPAYKSLFDTSLHSLSAAHFVIHQHDHPVAGPHYDLRLQINPTSSASWAVMYGLPGDANSARLNRNATETRVHCLWNHLVETGSGGSGSLVVWDMGEYRVLEMGGRGSGSGSQEEEDSDGREAGGVRTPTEQQEKLVAAFHNRKIRLELKGAKLPRGYVINLRLPKEEDAAGRARAAAGASRRRRRRGEKRPQQEYETSSASDSDAAPDLPAMDLPAMDLPAMDLPAMEREIREVEDAEVRRTNAYPGATNSIGSVHQRRWYLSLDREASGFVKRRREGKVLWERDGAAGGDTHMLEGESENCRLSFPFYVRGPEVERSVITGRLGADVLRDEGVEGHVSRMGWRPVLN